MRPIVSIIIPFYNSASTIVRTIESLERLPQESARKAEVVFIDDGSTDSGPEIVEARKTALQFGGLSHLRQENGGTSSARNAGLGAASGDWIFFLDADDELLFDPVETTEKLHDCSAGAFRIRFMRRGREYGRLNPAWVDSQNMYDVFTSRNPFSTASLLFRKDRLDVLFDPAFIYVEDWLFWMQNPRIFEKIRIFADVTSAVIHSHGANKTANHVMHGRYRQKAAEKVLSELYGRLTTKQKNNLLIQSRIGMLQQGMGVQGDSFIKFPCDHILYLKLLLYFLMKGRWSVFDLYGGGK